MAASLWNTNEQKALSDRLNQLTEQSKRQWGKMDVAQMLKHIDIAYKNAIGEIPVTRHPMAFIASTYPARRLLIFGIPFQKNLPTAEEYKVKYTLNFQVVRNEFLNTFQKVTQHANELQFAEHPVFGKLNKEEWGALLHKHLDHHLRQFGV